MALRLHWFLPTHGDGRGIGRQPRDGGASGASERMPTAEYLGQVARAAELAGFESVLVPAGMFCQDPWVVSAALIGETKTLGFMIAVRPGMLSPVAAAQMAQSMQVLSSRRLLLNVVVGGDADELRRYGDWAGHDARYRRAAEFIAVMRGAWSEAPFDYEGSFFKVAKATVVRSWSEHPLVLLGGSSDVAREAAARHADVYLAWGEPPGDLTVLLDKARAEAVRCERRLSLGSRFNVITRDTSAEAWAEAGRLLAGLDRHVVDKARRRFERSESEGQRRMAAHSASADHLEVYPNIWAGIGVARPGAGLSFVGSHAEVADRIVEYAQAGVDHLILSGQPHVEEAYWFGEGVMPILRRKGILAADTRAPGAGVR